MHFAHLILAFRNLDQLRLLPIQRWIPDVDDLLARPDEYLASTIVEIGPWFRFFTLLFGGGLFFLCGPFLVAVMLLELPKPLGICSAMAFLCVAPVFAWAIWQPFRGGTCLIDADGVHFCRKSFELFVPWQVLCAAGDSMYDPGRELLYLPLDSSQLDQIELRHKEDLVAAGVDVKAALGRVLPTGTLVLKIYYGVAPGELGDCLRAVARALDGGPDLSSARALATRSRRVQWQDNGWILVDLPAMVFPRQCCNCLEPTDDYRMFLVGSSTMGFWIPHCRSCVRASSWMYWRRLAGYALLFTLAITLLAALVGLVLDLQGGSPPGQFMFTGVLTLCAGVLGGFLCCFPAHFLALVASKPVRLCRYDPTTGTVMVLIRNIDFARLFAGESAPEA